MNTVTERWSREPRRAAELVDFAAIPESQQDMHARLENWGRACNGGASDNTAPMFRQARTPDHWSYGRDTVVPVDRSDAVKIGRGVYYLPEPHMKALQWYYVQRTSVMRGRRALACTAQALGRYVVDARTMLIDRGV